MFIYNVEEIRPGNYLKDIDGVFMKVVEIKGSTVEVISYMKPLNIEVPTEAYYRELMGVPLTENRVRVEWRSFPKGGCSVAARRGNVDCICKQRGETPGEMLT